VEVFRWIGGVYAILILVGQLIKVKKNEGG
jgi:hypothetical protein